MGGINWGGVAGFALGGPVGGAAGNQVVQNQTTVANKRQIGAGQQELNNANWDPNTFMPDLNHAPTAAQANNVDWKSQQLYQQAKNRYFQDALGSNAQAQATLGGYRAGGAAGQAASMLQNRGAMQLNIANSLERPDAFAGKRDAAAAAAASAAKNAQMMALGGGVLQAGATLGGAALMASGVGAPAGAAVMAAGAGASAANTAQATREAMSGINNWGTPIPGPGSSGTSPQPLSGGPQTGGAGNVGGAIAASSGGAGGVQSPGSLGSEAKANPTPLGGNQVAFSEGLATMEAQSADWNFLQRMNYTVNHYAQPGVA